MNRREGWGFENSDVFIICRCLCMVWCRCGDFRIFELAGLEVCRFGSYGHGCIHLCRLMEGSALRGFGVLNFNYFSKGCWLVGQRVGCSCRWVS